MARKGERLQTIGGQVGVSRRVQEGRPRRSRQGELGGGRILTEVKQSRISNPLILRLDFGKPKETLEEVKADKDYKMVKIPRPEYEEVMGGHPGNDE
mmetsp:Transcript_6678/g.28480  ORF Transcript_6678/g.28480 Transcript_6678/m.28480 type:complete len:97 (-) Transcript_6678:957-1247(-)